MPDPAVYFDHRRPDLAPIVAEYLAEHPASADPDARLSDVVRRWPDVTIDEVDRALRITGELADMELVEAMGGCEPPEGGLFHGLGRSPEG